MRNSESHLSDNELVLAADGELSAGRRQHLKSCAECQSRQRELENASAAFARMQEGTPLPSADFARARLRARMAEIPSATASWTRAAAVCAATLVCCAGLLLMRPTQPVRAMEVPSPRLTPGATRTVDRAEVCNADLPKNQMAPAELRQRVFQVYGLNHADPQAYEVDYLITPALGGADDIRNLWPQPYHDGEWNAQVKDALEDRLRDLVCSGQLDLAEAQKAIATDWIAAYKKYFGTDRPAADVR